MNSGPVFRKDQNKSLTTMDDKMNTIEHSEIRLTTDMSDLEEHKKIPRREKTEIHARRILIEKIFSGDYTQKADRNLSSLEEIQWEYVIVLKNPDYHGSLDHHNHVILEDTVEEFYVNCFKPKKTGNPHKDRHAFYREKEIFLKTYKSLQDLKNGKKLLHGGKMIMTENGYTDTGAKSGDFTTLVRNAIYYKIVGSLYLTAKQIISNTGEYIYIVMAADETDLSIEASRIRYSKELEIALTDLQSLYPCDKSLRPMHLLKFQDTEIKNVYKDIKSFIHKAFGYDKVFGKVGKYEPNGVTIVQKQIYQNFLVLLKTGIFKIESSISTHKHQMFLLQKLIRESLDKVNLNVQKEDRLLNLWDQLGIEKPIAAYAEFYKSRAENSDGMWRTHEIDELGQRSLFKGMERLRLISSLIDTQISLTALHDRGYVVAYYPLHNNWKLKRKVSNSLRSSTTEEILLRNILIDFRSKQKNLSLVNSWNTSLINQKVPLNKIRNYFGEKIALYFEFLRFSQTSLLIPSLVGLFVFCIQNTYSQDSIFVLTLNAIYSIFMTVWATVFLEYWRRKEAKQAIIWGQTKLEKIEVPRPQYKGTSRRSPITDDMDEIHFEPRHRLKYFILAFFVSGLVICMVLGIVASLLLFKKLNSGKYEVNGVDIIIPITSVVNAIQIQVFNYVYERLAKKLTELENHKTYTQYEDSLVLKTFVFQFVNSFNSVFYIGFGKTYIEGCSETNSQGQKVNTIGASCMNELYIQLVAIFAVSYLKNLFEIGYPLIKYYIKKRRKKLSRVKYTGKKDIRHRIESQLNLDSYLTRDKDGTIDDYLELVMQFGYLTLFALVFPLSTLLAFLGFWLEMFSDKLKIIRLVRRPDPLPVKDIGTWWYIYSTIGILAIFSNTALFCFTSRTFKDFVGSTEYEYLIFTLIVVVLMIFRTQIQSWIPDIAEKYEIVMDRHDYILEKVFRGSNNKVHLLQEEEHFDGTIYFTDSNEFKVEELI
jgi:Calcium-activated chloride channel